MEHDLDLFGGRTKNLSQFQFDFSTKQIDSRSFGKTLGTLIIQLQKSTNEDVAYCCAQILYAASTFVQCHSYLLHNDEIIPASLNILTSANDSNQTLKLTKTLTAQITLLEEELIQRQIERSEKAQFERELKCVQRIFCYVSTRDQSQQHLLKCAPAKSVLNVCKDQVSANRIFQHAEIIEFSEIQNEKTGAKLSNKLLTQLNVATHELLKNSKKDFSKNRADLSGLVLILPCHNISSQCVKPCLELHKIKNLDAFKAFEKNAQLLCKESFKKFDESQNVFSRNTVSLSNEAQSLYEHFLNEITTTHTTKTSFFDPENISALTGLVLRIALIFEVFEKPSMTQISKDTLNNAIEFAITLLHSQKTFQDYISTNQIQLNAIGLIHFLEKKGLAEFNTSEILQLGPAQIRKKEHLDPVLKLLSISGLIKQIPAKDFDGVNRQTVFEVRSFDTSLLGGCDVKN